MDPVPAAPDLTDAAQSFARAAPQEKVALLQAILARLAPAAPALHAMIAEGRGLDASASEGLLVWSSTVVPWIAYVRALAASLDSIARRGRPPHVVARVGADGRARVLMRASTSSERWQSARVTAEVRFEEGVRPADIAASQAGFYSQREPEGAVVSIASADLAGDGLARALFALFVEGKIVVLSPDARSAALVPVLEGVLAPLIERGALRFAADSPSSAPGIDAPSAAPIDAPSAAPIDAPSAPAIDAPSAAAIDAPSAAAIDAPSAAVIDAPSAPGLDAPSAPVPWLVVPYLYAADELALQARSLAGWLVQQAVFGRDPSTVLVVARGWEQRAFFLDLVQKALAARPSSLGLPSMPVAGWSADVRAAFSIVDQDARDPARFIADAVTFVNQQLGGGRGLALTVHPSTEDEPAVGPALRDAIHTLRYGAIAVNAPPSLIHARPALPWGAQGGVGGFAHNALMLGRVDKVVLHAPLAPVLRPAYFCDHRRAPLVGARLAAMAAKPSLGGLLGLIRAQGLR